MPHRVGLLEKLWPQVRLHAHARWALERKNILVEKLRDCLVNIKLLDLLVASFVHLQRC